MVAVGADEKKNCSGGGNGQDELKMTLAFLGMP